MHGFIFLRLIDKHRLLIWRQTVCWIFNKFFWWRVSKRVQDGFKDWRTRYNIYSYQVPAGLQYLILRVYRAHLCH